jgi:hypothetical protein
MLWVRVVSLMQQRGIGFDRVPYDKAVVLLSAAKDAAARRIIAAPG